LPSPSKSPAVARSAPLQVRDRIAADGDRGLGRGDRRSAGDVAGPAEEDEETAVAQGVLRPARTAFAAAADGEVVVAVAVQVAERGDRGAEREVLDRVRRLARAGAEEVRRIGRDLPEHQVGAADVRELAGEPARRVVARAGGAEADEPGIGDQHVVEAVAVHVAGDDGGEERAVLRARRARARDAGAEDALRHVLERGRVLRDRVGPELRKAQERAGAVLAAPRLRAREHVADGHPAGGEERRRRGDEDVRVAVVVPVQDGERAALVVERLLEERRVHRAGRVDHLPQPVLVGDGERGVHPGAGDVPRDLDPAADPAEQDREHRRVAVVARPDEDEVGEAVAAHVAHALGRAADLAVDDVVGLVGDAGDRVDLHRTEQDVGRPGAVHQEIAHPIAVEVDELHRVREAFALLAPGDRERIADERLGGRRHVHPRHARRAEPGRDRARVLELVEVRRQAGRRQRERLGHRPEQRARVDAQRVAAGARRGEQRARHAPGVGDGARRAEEERRERPGARGREARAARLEHEIGRGERAGEAGPIGAEVDLEDLALEPGELVQPFARDERRAREVGLPVAVEVADRAEVAGREGDRVRRTRGHRARERAAPAEHEQGAGRGRDEDVGRPVAVDVARGAQVETGEGPLDGGGEDRTGARRAAGEHEQLVERVDVREVRVRPDDAEVRPAVEVHAVEPDHVAEAGRRAARVGEGDARVAQPVGARAPAEELDVRPLGDEQVAARPAGERGRVAPFERALVDDDVVEAVARHVPEQHRAGEARAVEHLPPDVVVAGCERDEAALDVLEAVQAVVVGDELPVDVQPRAVVAPGREAVVARRRDEHLPGPADGEVLLQVEEAVEPGARATELDQEVGGLVVRPDVLRPEPLHRLGRGDAGELARSAGVEVGREREHRPAGGVEQHAQVVDRPRFGRAGRVTGAAAEQPDRERVGGVRDRLQRRLAPEVVQRVRRGAEPAVLVLHEAPARRRNVALYSGAVAEGV
jgi:hypothetical protein